MLYAETIRVKVRVICQLMNKMIINLNSLKKDYIIT